MKIDKELERELTLVAERALGADGYRLEKIKHKHYWIEKGGHRTRIAIRTSTDRTLGFYWRHGQWRTLGDTRIEGYVIAAFDISKDDGVPSGIEVYRPVTRENLLRRFDEKRAALGRRDDDEYLVFVFLDRAEDKPGSGIIDGAIMLAEYQRGSDQETVQAAGTDPSLGESKPDIASLLPKLGSISMVVDLDEEERRSLAARYAGRVVEVNPKRVEVEVRITMHM